MMHVVPFAVVLVLALPLAISLAAPAAGLSVPRSFLARTSDARTSTARCPSTAVIGTSNTPAQLAAHYDMTPLLDEGDEGQGVRVAVVEFEPDQRSDIAAYQSCEDSHAKVNYIPVGEPKVLFARGGSEATLDIETIIGLAPKATIDVYQAPKNATPAQIIAVYKTIVTRNLDSVISISWGECELDTSSSVVAAERSLFAQAYAQGQTIYAAAGDSGLTGCGGTQHSLRSTDDPASQPDVIGVGGTSISGAHTETVWNRGTGIGGGGISLNAAMPRFQHAVFGDQQGLWSATQVVLPPGSRCERRRESLHRLRHLPRRQVAGRLGRDERRYAALGGCHRADRGLTGLQGRRACSTCSRSCTRWRPVLPAERPSTTSLEAATATRRRRATTWRAGWGPQGSPALPARSAGGRRDGQVHRHRKWGPFALGARLRYPARGQKGRSSTGSVEGCASRHPSTTKRSPPLRRGERP